MIKQDNKKINNSKAIFIMILLMVIICSISSYFIFDENILVGVIGMFVGLFGGIYWEHGIEKRRRKFNLL